MTKEEVIEQLLKNVGKAYVSFGTQEEAETFAENARKELMPLRAKYSGLTKCGGGDNPDFWNDYYWVELFR